MHDQASLLRSRSRLHRVLPIGGNSNLNEAAEGSESQGTRVVAITSGKGGVGKTNIVVNLAAALALRGKKVLVLDADFGLANVDVLLGLAPKFHLGHFLYGEKHLRDILVMGPQGIPIIPAGPGIQLLSQLEDSEAERLFTELNEIIQGYDFLLIDTATGISDNVTRLLMASQQIVVVCSPDPTAVVDAYAVIKIVSQMDPSRPLQVLVNGVSGGREGDRIFGQIATVTRRFLCRELCYLGYVSQDEKLVQAVRDQRAVVLEYPFSRASFCFRHLAKELTPAQVRSIHTSPRFRKPEQQPSESSEVTPPC